MCSCFHSFCLLLCPRPLKQSAVLKLSLCNTTFSKWKRADQNILLIPRDQTSHGARSQFLVPVVDCELFPVVYKSSATNPQMFLSCSLLMRVKMSPRFRTSYTVKPELIWLCVPVYHTCWTQNSCLFGSFPVWIVVKHQPLCEELTVKVQ